jgi:DNA-binding transcriptional regulator YdaS (Cro superfamily)
MKLEQYVRKHYNSVAEASRDFGVSRQYLYELFNGKSTPSPTTAKRIEKCTGGKVTAASLLGV